MSLDAPLLDTPIRRSLQSQSTQIRAILKDFERTFAADNEGRKPSKDDIKADVDVAAKYKEYNKIRDVLAGKLDYSIFTAPPKSSSKRRKQHERTDSGVSWTPRRRSHEATPRKLSNASELEVYDATRSASPKPVLLHAIGPTPQRDGKVLGLFDMLSDSAHSSRATSLRKRKLDAIAEESPRKIVMTAMAQTPSRRANTKNGDVLDHLIGISDDTPETGRRKLSKTPISEGRKFMLSQFFATPSTVRYSNVEGSLARNKTPLRDRILGMTPEDKPQQQASDATPAFLRRSTSFKDRLLSASQPSLFDDVNATSPPARRLGPPTLRHLRSIPKIFRDFASKVSDVEEEDEHEDDLEALREMEDGGVNVLVQDSQRHLMTQADNENSGAGKEDQSMQRIYKKKGQKRTTRRANMKPAKGKSADAPKFVAAGHESDEEEDISQVNETQINGQTSRDHHIGSDGLSDDDFHDLGSDVSDIEKDVSKKSKSTKDKSKPTSDKVKKSGTINPNAVTHMNFRTLKIKNKNSKAKGRGRFGRGRR